MHLSRIWKIDGLKVPGSHEVLTYIVAYVSGACVGDS